MEEKVAVVLVNWNSGDLLRQSVAALLEQKFPIWQIVIVDNASTDDSLQHVTTTLNLDRINIIRLNDNTGFAAGNNHAFRLIKEAEWVALLNPDAIPHTDWLFNLMHAAKDNPSYTFFASRLLSFSDTSRLDGAGDLYHTSGYVKRRGHKANANQYLKNEEVFSPCAAAALYRMDTIMSVAGFDEDYFCYSEDIDLGFRLRLVGHRCLYVANATVRHVGSAVTGVYSDFSTYYGHRNMVWTFVKNMPLPLFLVYLPQHILLNIVSFFWLARRGQTKIFLRAKWDAVKGLRRMWHKRKAIQAQRQVPIKSLHTTFTKGLPI